MLRNNLSRFFIQRPGLIHDFFLWVALSFFTAMVVWGVIIAAEFVGQLIHENRMYNVEREIEAGQLYVRLTVDKAKQGRDEEERKKAIADLCKRDKRGATLF